MLLTWKDGQEASGETRFRLRSHFMHKPSKEKNFLVLEMQRTTVRVTFFQNLSHGRRVPRKSLTFQSSLIETDGWKKRRFARKEPAFPVKCEGGDDRCVIESEEQKKKIDRTPFPSIPRERGKAGRDKKGLFTWKLSSIEGNHKKLSHPKKVNS